MLEALQAGSSLDAGGRDAAAAAAAHGVLSRLTSWAKRRARCGAQADGGRRARRRREDGRARARHARPQSGSSRAPRGRRRCEGLVHAHGWRRPLGADAARERTRDASSVGIGEAVRARLGHPVSAEGSAEADSPEFARDLDEVRTGGRVSARRVRPTRPRRAIFWTLQTPRPLERGGARRGGSARNEARSERAAVRGPQRRVLRRARRGLRGEVPDPALAAGHRHSRARGTRLGGSVLGAAPRHASAPRTTRRRTRRARARPRPC